jgi:hypothetical protein
LPRQEDRDCRQHDDKPIVGVAILIPALLTRHRLTGQPTGGGSPSFIRGASLLQNDERPLDMTNRLAGERIAVLAIALNDLFEERNGPLFVAVFAMRHDLSRQKTSFEIYIDARAPRLADVDAPT